MASDTHFLLNEDQLATRFTPRDLINYFMHYPEAGISDDDIDKLLVGSQVFNSSPFVPDEKGLRMSQWH